MIIKCVICKNEFDQEKNERKCRDCIDDVQKYHSWWKNRFTSFFQDPIYQWYREFVSNEQIPPKIRNLSYIFKGWNK